MNHMSQWSFYLVDKAPGSSLDDAADLIHELGGDPWSLQSLDCISTTQFDDVTVSEFAATGPSIVLEQLRSAHTHITGSTTQPLVRVPTDQFLASLPE